MADVQTDTPSEPMGDAKFWKLVDLVRGSKWDEDTTDFAPLISVLSSMSPDEISGFYETLARKLYALDTRKHHAAFSHFPGFADTFLYTRLAVVAQGEVFYEEVLRDPQHFPGRSPAIYLEGLLYVAASAYLQATGSEFQRKSSVSVESFSNDSGWSETTANPSPEIQNPITPLYWANTTCKISRLSGERRENLLPHQLR